MSLPAGAQTGAEVMAQFIPASPFAAKLGIVAEVLDGDEVRLRMPFDPTNVTLGDMVHGGAIASLADMTVMAAAWAGADVPELAARCDHVAVDAIPRAGAGHRPDRGGAGARRGKTLVNCDVDVVTPEGDGGGKGDRHLQSGIVPPHPLPQSCCRCCRCCVCYACCGAFADFAASTVGNEEK